MTQYIDKSAVLAEIENIKSIEFNEGTPSDNYACMALDMVIETLDTLEVKEDSLFTEKKIEKELADSWIDRVDRKRIPIELKGELKAKFKNEFHTMWQTVGALQFANAAKHIMERLCLHFAAWGVYNLKDIGKISLKEKQKMDVEVKEVDLEKEWKEYFKYRGDVATVNIKHLAKHFFELGMSVSNVSK